MSGAPAESDVSAVGGASVASLGVLASLYFSQGLPFGFFTQVLPVLLREQGASLPAIGLSNLLLLPWLLKFLWAPRVDSLAARRSGLLRGLSLLTAVVLALPALASPQGDGGLVVLMLTMLVASLLAATQDVATDALAVQTLAPAQVGLGNALQVGGYRLGMIVGGGALLVVFARQGWAASFLGMGGVLAVAALPVILAGRRLNGEASPATPGRSGDAAWRDWLRDPSLRAWLLVLVAVKLGDSLAGAMVKPMLVDDGWTKATLGAWLGAGGSALALIGALLGGLVVRRLGALRTVVGFGVLQTLPLLGWASMAPEVPAHEMRVVDVRHEGELARVELRGVQPGVRVEVAFGEGPAISGDTRNLEGGAIGLLAPAPEVSGTVDVRVRAGARETRARQAWRGEGGPRPLPWMLLLAGFENLAGSIATVAVFACMMQACRRQSAGVDYTVQACAFAWVQGGAGLLSGLLAEGLGWSGFFALAAGISLLSLLWIARSARVPAPAS